MQTGDVIRLAHPDYLLHSLTRYGGTDRVLDEIDFAPPPFQPLNDTATTVYASAATGAITLHASASLFTLAMVGQYVYLAEKDVRSTTMWKKPAKPSWRRTCAAATARMRR